MIDKKEFRDNIWLVFTVVFMGIMLFSMCISNDVLFYTATILACVCFGIDSVFQIKKKINKLKS